MLDFGGKKTRVCTRVLQPAGRVRVVGTRVRVGYGYEHGMHVKIGNLERQISFVKIRFIRNWKIYIVKYCCLVKIIQVFLNNCLGWLSLYYLFQLAPPVVKEFLVKLDGHSRHGGNYQVLVH